MALVANAIKTFLGAGIYPTEQTINQFAQQFVETV